MKIKRIIALFFALVVIQTMAAQNQELSVSYGSASVNNIADDFGLSLAGALAGYKSGDISYSGTFNLQYIYNLSKTIGVGAILNYEHSKYTLKDNGAGMGDIDGKDDYITIMPAAKFNWTHGKTVRLYSKIALGACFDIYENYEVKDDKVNKKSKTNVDFAYQVSALGVEVGQSVCGFAELGSAIRA